MTRTPRELLEAVLYWLIADSDNVRTQDEWEANHAARMCVARLLQQMRRAA